MTEESHSRFVTRFVAADGCPVMVNEREIFLILARVSRDVQTRLHSPRGVQWIKKHRTQHHPYGWEVRLWVILAGGGGGGTGDGNGCQHQRGGALLVD